MPYARFVASLLFLVALPAVAQTEPSVEVLSEVQPAGRGRIEIAKHRGMSISDVHLYDDDTRPVLQIMSKQEPLQASYILFPNRSGKPSAAGCQEDVLAPLQRKFSTQISQLQEPAMLPGARPGISTSSYLLTVDTPAGRLTQKNVFAFAGDDKTCAELHLSIVSPKPASDVLFGKALAGFAPDLSYVVLPQDLLVMATLLYQSKSFAEAAPYYRSALALLPATASTLEVRRFATDQLAMSLGISGNLKESRSVLEQAIAADPQYALNYYNLACADAEAHDAPQAQLHLKQAFDRKANVLSGEGLPDPAKDDSFLKLKNDKSFWRFVQSLSRGS